MAHIIEIKSVRPLVRYVDEDQAVIETHLSVRPADSFDPRAVAGDVQVLVNILGHDGFHDEGRLPLKLAGGTGAVRFDLVHPHRWWPAGMGEQPLYQLTVSLFVGDLLAHQRTLTLGLTSVRPEGQTQALAHLLVNGQHCDIQTILMVDRANEQQFLPATGDSLILVRDHYGPELLYDAADRAGILLVQSVPIHPAATPELDVADQVDRLAAHPSLAGYFVGHLGRLSDVVAKRLGELDPTRTVFRSFPQTPAA